MIVVRAWLERDGRVRARVTATDLATREETVSAADGADEIVGLVRSWLDRLAATPPT